jgi:hypothetical protein
MNLTSRASFLAYLARYNPRLWELVHPHEPVLSVGTRHVIVSMAIKSIAKEIKDPNIAKELQRASKGLFDAGVQSMSYDDDDWCPVIPRHHFDANGPSSEPWLRIFGGGEVMLNPQPLPPKEHVYYGAILTTLADAVSLENFQDVLRNIGTSLMESYSRETNANAASFSQMENGID